jgi:hypothetical protein
MRAAGYGIFGDALGRSEVATDEIVSESGPVRW